MTGAETTNPRPAAGLQGHLNPRYAPFRKNLGTAGLAAVEAGCCGQTRLSAYDLGCTCRSCCWNGPSRSGRCCCVVTASKAAPSATVKVAATG
jgi:hypothetical protein